MTSTIHPAQLETITRLERSAIALDGALTALTTLIGEVNGDLSPAGRKHVQQIAELAGRIQTAAASPPLISSKTPTGARQLYAGLNACYAAAAKAFEDAALLLDAADEGGLTLDSTAREYEGTFETLLGLATRAVNNRLALGSLALQARTDA